MRLEEARIAVDEALSAYRRCVEAEVEEYGPEYERVTFMEYEAPAPDPCAEAFLRLVEAVHFQAKTRQKLTALLPMPPDMLPKIL